VVAAASVLVQHTQSITVGTPTGKFVNNCFICYLFNVLSLHYSSKLIANSNLTFGVEETSPPFGISDVGGFVSSIANEVTTQTKSEHLQMLLL
jgi:hypothetical protein